MPEKNITAESKMMSKKCTCCPYGFHIDRDFVRFCDSRYNSAQLDKLRQHKRERRKEKKSVESYLGLASFTVDRNKNNTTLSHQNQNKVSKHKKIIRTSSERFPKEFYLQNDDLKNAVNDFEDTWKKTHGSFSSHVIDTRSSTKQADRLVSPCAPQDSSLSSINLEETRENRLSSSYISSSSSTSSVSSQSTMPSHILSSVSGDISNSFVPDINLSLSSVSKSLSCIHQTVGIKKSVLSNIREQMASSLHHMKELEEQVKSIPLLKGKIMNLSQEKKSLLNELKLKESISVVKDSAYESLEKQLKKLENEGIMSPTLSKRCLYKCHQSHDPFSPKVPSVELNMYDKIFSKSEIISHSKMNDGNDTDKSKYTKNVGTSCNVLTRDIGIGYIPNKYKSIAVGSDFLSHDYMFKSGSFEKPSSISSGSLESDLDSLSGKSDNHIFCSKTQVDQLTANKTSISSSSIQGVLVDSSTNTELQYVDKCSNTENIGSCAADKHFPSEKYAKHKGISALPLMINKYIQVSNKQTLKHAGVQASESAVVGTAFHLFKYHDCGVGDFDIANVVCDNCNKNKKSIAVGDCEINAVCKKCDLKKSTTCFKTTGVGEFDINILCYKSCQENIANDKKNSTISTGTNTNSDDSFKRKNIYICDKCSETIHSVAQGLAADHKESNVDYNITKIQGSVKKLPNLKPLDIDQANSGLKTIDTFEKTVHEKEIPMNIRHKSEAVQLKDDENLSMNIRFSLNNSFSSEVLPQFTNLPHIPRKKYEFPKGIKAACKVLNDHLQKAGSGNEKKMLSSLKIIQTEWFQAANQKKADPHLIEDYIDAFEGFSKLLLHKIVNLSDSNGNTALHYAVSYGNFDVVSILIDSKVCDVNMKNKAGYTSIMLVALAEIQNDTHHYVVQRLFSIGDINMKATQNGQTALMLAVSHGKKDMVKILLDVEADINLQDRDGSTALMCAAEHGHLEIAKSLLSHSECDPTLVDNDGCTALTIAMEAGHKDIGLLIYTNMNFSRGSSPYSTLKSRKRSTPRSTPPPHTPTLRTPPLPSPATKSMQSLTTFHFS